MWHPMKYAAMLADKTDKHGARAWFVNTGWSGGRYGVGKRVSLKHTRAIIDAIHSGELEHAEYTQTSMFGFHVPKRVTGVPDAVLQPRSTWADCDAYDSQLEHLANLFAGNMKLYETSQYISEELIDEIRHGGPQLAGSDTPSEEDETAAAPAMRRVASCAVANGSAIESITIGSHVMT